MSVLLILSWYQEILILDLMKDHNLGLFKRGWYVEMDELNNFHLDLYLLCLDEEGVNARARIFTFANLISDDLLHVQVEVIEGDTCFLLQTNLIVGNFRHELMISGPIQN